MDIGAALLNLLWPGMGYVYRRKSYGVWTMLGFGLIAMIAAYTGSNFLTMLGVLIMIITAAHFLYEKDGNAVIKDYIVDTLNTIAKKIERYNERYNNLKAWFGGETYQLQQVKRHIQSLKEHYNKAKAYVKERDYHNAAEEATYAYQILTYINNDLNALERDYLGLKESLKP